MRAFFAFSTRARILDIYICIKCIRLHKDIYIYVRVLCEIFSLFFFIQPELIGSRVVVFDKSLRETNENNNNNNNYNNNNDSFDDKNTNSNIEMMIMIMMIKQAVHVGCILNFPFIFLN